MIEKVQNVRKELESLFNVPAKVADDAVKINVKQINSKAFKELCLIGRWSEIDIKRSGAGITVIAKPII